MEGKAQSQEVRKGENVERENQLKGTTSRRVPHLEKEMDQMRRAMEEIRENMIRMNHVNGLIHRTDSPFIASINSHPLPSKFKMPSLDSYNGTHDLCDHIATFKTTMHLQGVLDEIMCRAFHTTLKGQNECGLAKYLRTPLVLLKSWVNHSKIHSGSLLPKLVS